MKMFLMLISRGAAALLSGCTQSEGDIDWVS